jgi:hypothetical protein
VTDATIYCDIPREPGSSQVDVEQGSVLFSMVPAPGLATVCGGQQATVTLDGDLELKVTPAWMSDGDEDYGLLAARRVDPTTPGLCFVATGPTLTHLWALGPEAEIADPGFRFSAPNDTGLAPGASLGVYVLGGLTTTLFGGESVGEGEWVRQGAARVTDDGTRIEGSGEAAVTYLSWLGLAPE